MKLDIYNSKRKNKADDRMTDTDITDRFEDDVTKDEGDWGDTQKKYSPGPTYEEEMDQLLNAILTEAKSFSPKHTDLDLTTCSVCGVKGHVPAKHFGKALSAENNQPVKESHDVEPKVVGHFIQTHLPSGKEHKGAMMDTHLRELGVNGRLSTGEKVTKDHILNHWNASQPKTYKYRWMKEGEEEGPVKKCPDCGKAHAVNAPCSAKEVLMGDEMCESKGKKHKQKFDKTAHIKAIARNTVGAVPKGQVIVPKDDRKKPKHKQDWRKQMDEAVNASSKERHEYAAKKHDEAAEHAKSGGAMIDRPYKDAFNASFRTNHPEIAKHIRSNASHYNYDYIPHRGSRHDFHQSLAQMHRDAASKE